MPDQIRASPPAPAADALCTPPPAARTARSTASAATTTPSSAASTRKRAATTVPTAGRYVDLGDAAPVMSDWLNDPSYMKLETYFAEDQKRIAATFGLKGLKPVLVKPDPEEGNDYLITDGKSYWMFNELDWVLYKFKNGSLTQSMVVDLVEEERYSSDDLVAQHPPPGPWG